MAVGMVHREAIGSFDSALNPLKSSRRLWLKRRCSSLKLETSRLRESESHTLVEGEVPRVSREHCKRISPMSFPFSRSRPFNMT